MTGGDALWVCPVCRGPLRSSTQAHACATCRREYPVICGIPDFRVEPDPYISFERDRRKGADLHQIAQQASFEQLLRHYYAITPEDPPDLAAHWISHALAEVSMADALLRDSQVLPVGAGPSDALLDIGCSTGALLIAGGRSHRRLVGVDVAFRWLVIGQARLREAGIDATLACANAEYLPFRDGSFQLVTCLDTLEHVRDARAALAQTYRVSRPGATLLCTANNRYAPTPEPNIGLWGVGYLPRRWQAAYVATRRRDLHRYRICLRSVWELARMTEAVGYRTVRADAAPLWAPHAKGRAVHRLIRGYNTFRRLPIIRWFLTMVGPRLRVRAERPLEPDQAVSTASIAPSPSTAEPAGT